MSDTGELDDLARRVGRAVHTQRTARGDSLGDLSRASGLSKTILARIERGEGNPSMETLWRLARALGLPLSALLTPDEEPRVLVIPAGSGEVMQAESGLLGRLLHAQRRAGRSELFELQLPAGADHRGTPHLPGTQELVICTKGRITAGPVGEEAHLRAGDAVWFAADVDHRYASARGATALNWVLYA
ncbi:MAG: helix-turn-helix domain-containing protein [Solirubrobacteraceae bacterium]|nr:helix-turn-helix domain-containing protein [Solirubrobacteraceae bacterium]